MPGWLKMEKTTPDKPEIMAIADALGIEPDLAFSKCFRFWAWVDEHVEVSDDPSVTDAHVIGITAKRIDLISRCEGLAKSLQKVGWIRFSRTGIWIPNFKKHFGEGAKQRALASNRMAKLRGKKRDDFVTLEPSPEQNRTEQTSSDQSVSDQNAQSAISSATPTPCASPCDGAARAVPEQSDQKCSDSEENPTESDTLKAIATKLRAAEIPKSDWSERAAYLFRVAEYSGNDGGLLWQLAWLQLAHGLSERDVIDAVNGPRMVAGTVSNPIGHVRKTLENRVGKGTLAELLKFVPKGHPKGAAAR